jgi:hypothetical protein
MDFSTGIAAKSEPAANAKRRTNVFFMGRFYHSPPQI